MSKDAADVTTTPEGLDVAVTMPGTIVGSHDLQGADGTERTDRPGEILGTPVISAGSAERAEKSRQREGDKADYITSAVDRANREELPKLGGPVEDNWEPTDEATSSAAKATASARQARGTTSASMPAPAGQSDSGVRVKSAVDRG